MYIPSKKEILDFVRESNAIESIFESDSHPLVQDHIAAIAYVLATLQEERLPTYSDIHRILLASEPEKTPGLYRQVGVQVADYIAPAPVFVMGLMDDYWGIVLAGPKQEDIDQWTWDMHFEFESILSVH